MANRGAKINLYKVRRCPECARNDRILKCGICYECYRKRQDGACRENKKRGELCLVKIPANRSERQFIESAEAKGWKVIRKGWPDYLCFMLNTDGTIKEIMGVEVKPNHSEGLKFHQSVNCSLLNMKGIDCYLYGAQERALRKIESDIPFDVSQR
jgi:hypothetical protein